ncbi:uncharacterized protein LOC128620365 [Ictalurus furcatus]|uniref:uncharacterized protein LOC128620365 n=1 Tax=Ictalurus furcatus TaxID=66913 RepID=UPI0023505A3B|nr:uncharacterized protein LOC128620365 [Ictalurus furcatus]
MAGVFFLSSTGLRGRLGRSETSTQSRKTDTTPPSKPPQSKITNSPPPLSSTTLEQGCSLSGDKHVDITGYKGGSVLLPCSCFNLHTKPQIFTWWLYRTERLTEMLNDECYRDRLQLFNHISPANLSLLISDLREEDQGVYRCSTEKEHRDIRLFVKVGRRETSTHSKKPDTTTPSEPPQSKTTNSPPASSSTTLEQVFCVKM